MEHAIIQPTRIEQKYRGLLECAPDATVIANEQGTIVLVNTEAERLFGYSHGELLGENVEILVPEGVRDRRWERTPSDASDPQMQPMGTGGELYAHRKDRGTFPVEISLGFFNSEDGLLIVSAIRDITERKKVEDQSGPAGHPRLGDRSLQPSSLSGTPQGRPRAGPAIRYEWCAAPPGSGWVQARQRPFRPSNRGPASYECGSPATRTAQADRSRSSHGRRRIRHHLAPR